jgi:hypothetical protein
VRASTRLPGERDYIESAGPWIATPEARFASVPPGRKPCAHCIDGGPLPTETREEGATVVAAEDPLSHPDLVTVATRIPQGVVCLISALSFHELTTQVPHTIDVAVERGTTKPRLDYPPTHFYWFSGPAFHEGIETHELDGAPVRVYDPEKTLADCFRYRNQIGMDVVLEAMRLWRERRRKKLDALLAYARMRHVERGLRPYLEGMP